MTNFNLSACGVQEMNKQEMIEVNGGKIDFFKVLRKTLNVIGVVASILGIIMIL